MSLVTAALAQVGPLLFIEVHLVFHCHSGSGYHFFSPDQCHSY